MRGGGILPYSEWQHDYRQSDAIVPHANYLATGCGGVLYPPHILYKDALDKDLIISQCLYADDIWLKVMEYLNNINVVLADLKPLKIWSIEGSQKESLNSQNVSVNRNDIFFQGLIKEYGIKLCKE